MQGELFIILQKNWEIRKSVVFLAVRLGTGAPYTEFQIPHLKTTTPPSRPQALILPTPTSHAPALKVPV